jgi:hypothetical protein
MASEPLDIPDHAEHQAGIMVTMLDTGWTIAAIADHFGNDAKEVERAIADQLKSERNQCAIVRNPNAKDGER